MSGGSVMRIRVAGLGSDLDILFRGFWRDMIRGLEERRGCGSGKGGIFVSFKLVVSISGGAVDVESAM